MGAGVHALVKAVRCRRVHDVRGGRVDGDRVNECAHAYAGGRRERVSAGRALVNALPLRAGVDNRGIGRIGRQRQHGVHLQGPIAPAGGAIVRLQDGRDRGDRLVCGGRRRKVVRVRLAGHECVRSVERDGGGGVKRGAAHVGAVLDRAAVRVHPNQEAVREIPGRVSARRRLKPGRRLGQIHRLRRPRHVRAAAPIHGDSIPDVVRRSAVSRRVHECGPRGVELDHECIGAASQRRLKCPGRDRKIRRVRDAGHVRVAAGIDCDPVGRFIIGAADVRRVHERRSARIDLGDEGVWPRATARGLERSSRSRKIDPV